MEEETDEKNLFQYVKLIKAVQILTSLVLRVCSYFHEGSNQESSRFLFDGYKSQTSAFNRPKK